MRTKKILIIGGLLILITAVGFILLNPFKDQTTSQTSTKQELIPVDSITHGHGLSVDISDPNKVYIATHHGLLVLANDKELYRVGGQTDDYMGFSPHPTDSKIFFSSGHPSTGGNIGFQKSEDGGFSWKKVSNGLNGPVDFHAMTVSPINPNLIYGWFQGAIQRSQDGGKNWEKFDNEFVVVGLTADPKDEKVAYASSPQGLFISKDKGVTWNLMFDGFVSTIAINPQDSQKLLTFSEKQGGLVKSNNAGQTWEKTNADFIGETPLFISFNKQNPDIVYTLTEKNSIYKSIDGGLTWSKIR